jgi:Tol biopolymer transport system component/DNA-binding winged helix-turn-helix (wHTH) protein
MVEKGPSDGRVRFGVFEADLHSKELFKEGRRIPLANQSFVALATLLEHPGRLVSREELRRRLWPDDRVVEFDHGLNAIINRLREALGNGPTGAGLIETLPRRGYRFVGTLQADQQDQEDRQSHRALPRLLSRSRKRAAGLAIALSALVLVVAFTAAALLTRTSRSQFSNLKVTPLTSLVGREVAPEFSPDGDQVLFAWNGAAGAGGGFDLYSRGTDSERLLRITHEPALALHAAWAPGGGQIAFARKTERAGGVFLLPPGGEPGRLLAAASFLNEPFMQLSWAPDGRRVAYSSIEDDRLSHIQIIDVAGSKPRSLAKPAGCTDAGIPAFSPDGRWLAFVCASSIAVYDIDVLELATGATRSLSSLQGNPQGLAWTTGSDALIVANESDTDSGIWRITLGGHSSRLLNSEGALGPGVAVASRGIAFVRETDVIDIWRADLAAPSRASDDLIASTRTQLVPTYSPDGTRIAFQSSRSGNPEIWLADADGHNPVKLTSFNGPLTGAPSWCHDGRRIAFDSRASGSSAIYLLDVFEGRPHRLETSQINLALPVWSGDCRWIIASDGRTTLYRVPASGGPAERFTAKRSYRALVTGSSVVFNVAGNNNDVELWSKPVQGGADTPLEGMAHLSYSDSWSATPQGIYYTTSSSTRGSVVSFYDFTTRSAHVVRTLEGPPLALGGLGISVSPDGRWLLYTRSERSEGDIMLMQPDADVGPVARPP